MSYMIACTFEFFAYCCFVIAVFGSTCVWLDARRGNLWERYDVAKLFEDLRVILIIGTVFHIACLFLV